MLEFDSYLMQGRASVGWTVLYVYFFTQPVQDPASEAGFRWLSEQKNSDKISTDFNLDQIFRLNMRLLWALDCVPIFLVILSTSDNKILMVAARKDVVLERKSGEGDEET